MILQEGLDFEQAQLVSKIDYNLKPCKIISIFTLELIRSLYSIFSFKPKIRSDRQLFIGLNVSEKTNTITTIFLYFVSWL